jgi:hypothetical protein
MSRQPGDSDFTNVNVVTCIKVAGTQVLGSQQAALANADPTGDTMNSILVALRAHGLIAT